MMFIDPVDIEDMLVPPAGDTFAPLRADDTGGVVLDVSSDQFAKHIASGMRRLNELADAGDALAMSRLELVNFCHAADIEFSGMKFSGMEFSDTAFTGKGEGREAFVSEEFLLSVYDQAASFLEAGEMGKAVGYYNLHVDLAPQSPEGFLGLAICAIRLDRFDLGLVLAKGCSGSGIAHPRVQFITGVCAARLGDNKAAKHHLALTSRLARRDRQYRSDQRAAQQLLLRLQFAEG